MLNHPIYIHTPSPVSDTHPLPFLLCLSSLYLLNFFPPATPPPPSFSVIMAWRGVVKFMTFRSRGAGWWRTRIVSRIPAGICLSLMSELYNVSTPDNLALAICGRERESHLLHLVREQWLPLQCLFLLHNLITVLSSNMCTTWNGIMDSAIMRIMGDKILMLYSWTSVSLSYSCCLFSLLWNSSEVVHSVAWKETSTSAQNSKLSVSKRALKQPLRHSAAWEDGK